MGIRVYMQVVVAMVVEQKTSSHPNICEEQTSHIKTLIYALASLLMERLIIRLIPSQLQSDPSQELTMTLLTL
jgi:hypothetical protein